MTDAAPATLIPRLVTWPDTEGDSIRMNIGSILRWWHDPERKATFVSQQHGVDEYPDQAGRTLDDVLCSAFFDCTPASLAQAPLAR